MGKKKRERNSKPKKPNVPPETFERALAWAKEPQAAPEFVREVILAFEGAQNAGSADPNAARRAVEALARAMGIIPSSERVAPKPKKDAVPVDAEIAKLIEDEKKLKALERYVGRRLKEARGRIASLMASEHEKSLDVEKSPSTPSPERVLAGVATSAAHENEKPPPKEQEEAMGKNVIKTQTRQVKQDLILGAHEVAFKGTKIYNPEKGATLTPDLSLVGPKGRQVTWRALTNVIVLVFGMALPAGRIEKLFGKKAFSRASLADYCAFVAERLLPVYVAMAHEIAQCEIVMGDDCVSRITEITRYNRALKEWNQGCKQASNKSDYEAQTPKPSAPWHHLGESSLTRQLNIELDLAFQQNKTDTQATPKIKLHTSVLSGEIETGKPQTRVILYRSHLGSVGNLLSKILLERRKDRSSLVFVGDLSPSNHVTDPSVLKHVSITYAGCTSHARRSFKRHLSDDADNCTDLLDAFRALFHIEELIDEGRQSRRAEIRAETSMAFWNDIKEICESMQSQWSPATALGEGIGYVLNNFDALTLYCRDARLPASNDLSERLLRYEKLMDRSSFGRETVEGRARYDIIRSFWQSCVAAGVDPTHALLDVMLTSSEEVMAAPSKYTPQSISKRLKTDESRCLLLDKILHTSDLGSLMTYKLLDPNVPQDDDLA